MLYTFCSVLLGLLLTSSALAKDKLIFTIDIIRHGDRTPLSVSPAMEKIWPGEGQLTPKGMRQEYNLGKKLREQYVEKYQLLPKHFDMNSMYVRSSDMPRTLVSAQSFLLGLYPVGTGPTHALPNRIQPIPIHTIPYEQDSLLIPNHDKAAYRKLFETYLVNNPEWIQKNNALKAHYPAWSEIFGIPIRHLLDLTQVSDRLYIESLYHQPLPEGLSPFDATQIRMAGHWALLKIMNHPQLVLAVGKELADTIKQEMNLAAAQKRPLKYVLFVAHDSTLAAQLNLLGYSMDELPPYASDLNYSLFDNDGRLEVRVTYNEKPIVIEKCGGTSCELSQFNLII